MNMIAPLDFAADKRITTLPAKLIALAE
jgi:hypothetical protein